MAKIKVCIDAGHYGKYNQSPCNKAYYESDMAWKLHKLLKGELELFGIEVITTRSSQAKDRPLYDRGAASYGCDLFISVHSNAVGSSKNESVDYPVAYCTINGKADKIGQLLAECVETVMGTKQKARINKRKGNNGDYYGVLRGASAVGTPGIILEHSFHTNTSMTNFLLDDFNLSALAINEAAVIADYFGLAKKDTVEKPTAKPKEDADISIVYKVQCGAYTKKANAEKQLAKVKAAGFDAFIANVNGMYKVQCGAYTKKENAEKQLAKVKAAGFDAFIYHI